MANGGRLPEPHEVESRLLLHVIETLQQSPGIHRVEAQLLVHEAGVVARPFAEQGFQRHPRLFMVFPLDSAPKPPPPLDPEIEIRRWAEHDYQPAAALITSAYRGHVDSEINDQYRTLSGSLRFLNNIVRFPGCASFDPEGSSVDGARQARSLIGLVLCSGCVRMLDTLQVSAPDYRSHGLGDC